MGGKKNMLEPDRPQMKIRRMRIEYWITKATDTHSEYIILISFPLLQWLRERASILRLYTHCLSCYQYPAVGFRTEGNRFKMCKEIICREDNNWKN